VVSGHGALSERAGALGAALIAVTLWASAFVGIRSADRHLSPGALALGRLLVGSAALAIVVLLRRERNGGRGSLDRRTAAQIALCGVLWFGVYNVALNAAERRVDAGTAAMLVNVGPILIAVLAGAVLREGFPPRLVVGCLISFAGAAVIGLASSRQGVRESWGALLCLLAALAYAGGVVAQKPALRDLSALRVTWLACTVGAISCLFYAPALVHQLAHASGSAIAWTVYLGVAPTAIGFAAWAYALAQTTAGRMGSTTYLVPPLAVLLGWLLLGEVPPALALPGGLLCLCGVAVARRASAQPRSGRQSIAESARLRSKAHRSRRSQ